MPLDKIQIDIVHCFPSDHEPTVTPCGSSNSSDSGPLLEYNVIPVDATNGLAKKMLGLALGHFDLASTTVTGTAL